MTSDQLAPVEAGRGSTRLIDGAAVVPRHGTESLTGVLTHSLVEHQRTGPDEVAAMSAAFARLCMYNS